MSVKEIAKRQQTKFVNQTAQQIFDVTIPSDGWIATVRKVLSLSGAQLASRLGITKAAIYQAQRNERAGAITIKQMEKMAQAMNCRFVYAIIPHQQIEDLLQAQAHKKAKAIVQRASSHMALESQSLREDQIAQEIERLAAQFYRDMPSDFWDVE